jgi:hypothetical protein
MSPIKENFSVSAKLMGGEEAEAVVELVREKNPRLAIVDHGSYWSITAEREALVFDMSEVAEALGHPYTVTNFLTILASYKGEIDVRDASVVIKEFAPA